MELRNGLIKANCFNVTRKFKILSSYIPNDLALTFPQKSTFLFVLSTSKNDNINGQGARAILINGLDEDYNEINDIIKFEGKHKWISNREFFRINNAIILDCGELGSNEGDIYITSSDAIIKNNIPNVVYHTVAKEENMSSCGIYTVPRGYSMQFRYYACSAKLSIFNDIQLQCYMYPPNFCKLRIVNLYSNRANNGYSYPLEYTTPLGQTTDLILRARKIGIFKASFCSYLQFTLTPNE